MIPNYLKRSSATRLKPCQERMIDTCDVDATDGCCGVIPCKLCLEWEVYGEDVLNGSADFAGSSWTGTVAGGSFVAYWERNIYDECEFVVVFDDKEVYRETCYEGASCRHPGGEVAATIGYEEGTLSWSVYEPRELALVEDPETGCRDFFCGNCRCTCDCLCVTITETDGTIIQGEICTSSYPCDAPVWEGTIGYYDLSVALERDQYTDECVIILTSGSEEADPVIVVGCSDMSGSVTLYDGTIISVACKQCDCVKAECDVCDCEWSDPSCMIAFLQSTTIPDDECAGPRVVGNRDVFWFPAADQRPWVEGEDDARVYEWGGFHITIPCGLMPLRLYGIIVRRAQNPSGPSPHIDNDIVLPCEWYFIMYDESGNVAGIYYSYDSCCGRSEAVPTCQTRLSWIKFLGVPAGRGVYDFLWWSPSGTGFRDGFQGNGVLEGECPYSDGPVPCLL